MKAMVLTAPGHVELKQVPRPEPGPGEVLVKVTHGGICGTDLKIFDGGMPAKLPLIMGHEITGTIQQGEAPGGIGPGMRVIVDPTVFCNACFHCRTGQTHLCPNGELLGRERDGGFAEYVAVPAQNVFPLPDNVADQEAAFIQVFSTCVHAQRLSPVFPGESVLILGLGVTGQLHVQLARAASAGPLIGVTRSGWKRDLARELGADLAFAPSDDLAGRVADATGGLGADLVIETAGSLTTLAQALELVRIGGRVLPFGIYTETHGALPFYNFYYKEIRIINARASKGEAFPASIDLVARGTVKLSALITHVMPLDRLAKALTMLKSGGGKRMKIIMAT